MFFPVPFLGSASLTTHADMRCAGTFWCILSGQHEKACRTCWCSWSYIPIINNVPRNYAPSTRGTFYQEFLLSIHNGIHICTNSNFLIGWERDWGETRDIFSWSWVINCTNNWFSQNLFSFGRSWRGYVIKYLAILHRYIYVNYVRVLEGSYECQIKKKTKAAKDFEE